MNPEKQNKVVLIIVFALLAASVIVILAYQQIVHSRQFFEYNGFTIYEGNKEGLKSFQIQFFKEGEEKPFVINTRYNPNDLEGIPVYVELRENIIKERLFITMEPTLTGKSTIAFAEIDKYTENPFLFNLPTSPALIRKVEGNELPVITCKDASASQGVIMFKIGDKNQIYGEQGCVIIEAKTENDLMMGADRLSLTLLGVMEENSKSE